MDNPRWDGWLIISLHGHLHTSTFQVTMGMSNVATYSLPSALLLARSLVKNIALYREWSAILDAGYTIFPTLFFCHLIGAIFHRPWLKTPIHTEIKHSLVVWACSPHQFEPAWRISICLWSEKAKQLANFAQHSVNQACGEVEWKGLKRAFAGLSPSMTVLSPPSVWGFDGLTLQSDHAHTLCQLVLFYLFGKRRFLYSTQ
jgi:hypothetical protein